MSLAINLLPSAYRQALRRKRRLRVGVVGGLVLLAVELGVGVTAHRRAEDSRRLLEAADAAVEATRTIKKELAAPTQEAEVLGRQAALAERLRSKHRWSRLLGALARSMPEKVAMTSIMTDPPQWNPSLKRSAGGTAAAGESKHLVEGVILGGHAADHADLSSLVASLHASGMFASVDLRQARREKYLGHEAIAFELNCRW